MSRTVAVVGGGYGGPRGGVGQLPAPDGPAVVPATTVAEYKGADLFTGRFAELFGNAEAN